MKPIIKQIVVISLLLFSACLTYAEALPQLYVQLGHSDDVKSVKLSPDGDYLLSGSADRTVKLWERSTGRLIRTFSGHEGWVEAVDFVPGSSFIISAGQDKTVRVWDIKSGRLIRTMKGHSDTIFTLAVTSDGRFVASGGKSGEIIVWHLNSGRKRHSLKQHERAVTSLAISPDGRELLSGSWDKTLRLWNMKSGALLSTYKGHKGWIETVAFSTDGKQLISGGKDREIRVIDKKTGRPVSTLTGYNGDITGLIPLTDNKGIYSISSTGFITLHSLDNEKSPVKIETGRSYLESFTITSDGESIYTGGTGPVIKEWSAAGKNLSKEFSGFSSPLNSLAISPDGRLLAQLDNRGDVTLWSLVNNRPELKIEAHDEKADIIGFSPDSRLILTGGGYLHKELKLWEVEGGRHIKTLTGHSNRISSALFSPDSREIAAGSWDKVVRIWDVESGRLRLTLEGHEEWITAVVYSPDGAYLLSADLAGNLKLWESTTGRLLQNISSQTKEYTALAFTPDGRRYLTADREGRIELREIYKNSPLYNLEAHKGIVSSIIIVDEGKSFITAGNDRTIKSWDLGSGRLNYSLESGESKVSGLAIAPGDNYFYSTDLSGEIVRRESHSGLTNLSYYSFTNNEWLTMTPEGFYNSSPKGALYINVRSGLKVYPMDNFFEIYYRPDLVSARYKGEDIGKIVENSLKKELKPPPELYLTIVDSKISPLQGQNSYLSENKTVTIKVSAKDTGGGIKELRLYSNGKAIGENSRGLKLADNNKQQEQYFSVQLSSGTNRLQAVGFSSDMTQSNPVELFIVYEPPELYTPRMYILAIGIDQYKNSRYNLNFCVADSLGFVTTMNKGARKLFSEVIVTTLNNSEATRSNLLNSLEELKAKVKPEDLFVFFYAGHGIAFNLYNEEYGEMQNEFYYILHEVTQMTNEERCRTAGLSGSELKEYLKQIKASKQILFIDACNSGAFTETYAMRGAAEENALAKLSRSSGSIVVASTNSEQYAVEFEELGHGLFTYVIIKGLSGEAAKKSGEISAQALVIYVDERVPELSEKYKGSAQYPTTFMFGQDFPLGLK